MISSVRGTVLSASGTTAIVEVGGIGLAITVTAQHALSMRVGAEASIRTALIVREDDLALFGFAEDEQLRLFELLRGVTGVGPKSAMGVLSHLSPDEIALAVIAEDDVAFRKVSGIGPKTAKLIVVSLSGKLLAPSRAVSAGAKAGASDAAQQALPQLTAALLGLGWNERTAAQAAQEAIDAADESQKGNVQSLLRLALTGLGPARSERAGRDSNAVAGE